jgi:hypothetical protein
MKLIDTKQNNVIGFIIGSLAALGGLTAFIVYVQTKKHKKLELEILNLDKSIKELTLYNMKNGKKEGE